MVGRGNLRVRAAAYLLILLVCGHAAAELQQAKAVHKHVARVLSEYISPVDEHGLDPMLAEYSSPVDEHGLDPIGSPLSARQESVPDASRRKLIIWGVLAGIAGLAKPFLELARTLIKDQRPDRPEVFAINRWSGASRKVEVHALYGKENYQKFSFHAATAFPPVSDAGGVFLKTSDGSLCYVVYAGASGKTEVHIASSSSSYDTFSLQTPSVLHPTTSSAWTFAMAPGNDIIAVSLSPPSGRVEFHVLSASSQYSKFALQTPTPLAPVGRSDGKFLVASNRDVFFVLFRGASGKTEVHVLSSSSNYASFSNNIATCLEPTDNVNWDFVLAPNRDLYAIKKRGTSSRSTEVHVISASSNYQSFAIQLGTVAHETGSEWVFL